MQTTPLIVLLIALVVAIVALLGFIVYVITRRSHSKFPARIGRFRIIRELPSGGMSRIFLGKRPDGQHVIVKIPVESKPREETLSKFLDEGSILSKLRNPHIVGIEEYGKTTINGLQTGFVALEYVGGHSLDKLIKSGKKFSPQEASIIISSVADALAAAHKLGIYHRDISTNNIIVNSEGNRIKSVKLIDFGIAKWLGGGDYTTKDMMKEYYASPEQINREELDGRTDIYSLGIVYYELLTGRTPFANWERKTLPPSPVQLGLRIPELIDNLIMKMLEPDKEKRMQSASYIIQRSGVSPIGGRPYVAASRTGARKTDGTVRADNIFMNNKKAFAGISLAGIVIIVLSVFILKERAQSRNTGSRPHILVPSSNYKEQTKYKGNIDMTDPEVDIKKPQKVSGTTRVNTPEQKIKRASKPQISTFQQKNKSAKKVKRSERMAKKTNIIDSYCPYCGKRLLGKGFKFCPTTGRELPKRFWGIYNTSP